jgi:hypothetical protein
MSIALRSQQALAVTPSAGAKGATHMTDNANNFSIEAHDEDSGRNPAVVEKFVIRLPNGLRDRIRSLSEQNRRSMNSEIIMVLENHIRQTFMDQMIDANPDDGFVPGDRDHQVANLHDMQTELAKRLEKLSLEKKEALLELLG